ncbi:helix-turn-helix domain-containing protein [Teredinibacter sp. KSP-S5-2]|uniref:helix-turn-helix domain-containing protein n=1 Tax=Teredinibacter sp. KSP-S5-2 TaxID=3034506 RepID=UPI002934F8E5|nr:helix-turn-helix domain-containing protein [Teredinibacter sp. KSP-S5-2]WNO10904.1 helix-turn-helix domain-containing protein [Teredinibacter sp. KSP-S5-2]
MPISNLLSEQATPDGVDTGCSETVGTRLQTVRKIHGLSQRELARRAEVTNSTLSMIEQGKVSPSIASLEKIVNAIPMSLQEFFSDSLDITPPVFRYDQLVHVEKDAVDYRVLPINRSDNKGVFLAQQVYSPGAKVTSEWMVKNGYVGGMVIDGQIELHLEGTVYELKPGDGFYFSLLRSHSFLNATDKDCTVVCVSFGD